MKKRSVLSQSSSVVPVAVLAVLLMSGCGKPFEANSDGYRAAPPATADPLTAEDQRRWEAASENQIQVEPVLESDFEIEAFMNDLTEQAPAHTDEELAEEAERLHRIRRRGQTSKEIEKDPKAEQSQQQEMPPKSPSAERDQPTAPLKTTPSVTSPTTPAKPLTPKPEAPKPVVKPAPVVQSETRPARPTATIGSQFCKSLNVTSASANTDTSHLYNAPKTTTTVMPSKELAAANSVDKKNRFVCLLLPAAIRMNEEVYRMRLEVLRLQSKQKRTGQLEAEEKTWLTKMGTEFRAGVKPSGEVNVEELLKRVEVVPLALLLAQAAVESGWGTSNATKDLNNIFGIHAVGNEPYKTGYDTNNARMRVFPSVDAAISAYIRLLNTGTYYGKFREARARMRSQRQSMDSVALMKTLDHYSELRQKYINNVINIMTESNKLTQFVFKEEEVNTSRLE